MRLRITVDSKAFISGDILVTISCEGATSEQLTYQQVLRPNEFLSHWELVMERAKQAIEQEGLKRLKEALMKEETGDQSKGPRGRIRQGGVE